MRPVLRPAYTGPLVTHYKQYLQPQKPLNLARRKTFKIAQSFLDHYQNNTTTIDEILDVASIGYWSVWYTVFQPYPVVLSALETLHSNTAIQR